MTALVDNPSRSAAVLERQFAHADREQFVPLIVRGPCQQRIVLLVVEEFVGRGLFTLRFEGLRPAFATGRTATGRSEGRLVCDGRLGRSQRQPIA
jgi:hydroxyacyl-ACP dehydratase HTD2-like protein with hotdog domain